ncbi:hypothetical protein DERP_003679 [Dermatophagoides pteronyssinus]|uniref:Uncharacterized protein n=1 Tax=Dermatophagoides pteronyssinus TaxID=6956 RepID=A0ABQ8JM11_DERPT|nr:hypothetical protein DERP_003679 [Dermatophagoides pteronyssinus]
MDHDDDNKDDNMVVKTNQPTNQQSSWPSVMMMILYSFILFNQSGQGETIITTNLNHHQSSPDLKTECANNNNDYRHQ